MNTTFAYCFREAKFSTTGGSDFEYKKYVGQVSLIIRVLTSEDGDLISHFDKCDETGSQIGNTSKKHLIINNHDIAAKKTKNREPTTIKTYF